jgi:general L-amino acid transport system substrate-binding protein
VVLIGRAASRPARAGTRGAAALALLVMSCAPPQVASGAPAPDRVDSIRARGRLECGIEPGYPGFATVDEAGNHAGFDIDICRAIAAALLGSGARVDFVPSGSISQLAGSTIDVVSRRLTWSLAREQRGIRFGPIVFHDGAALMVPAASRARAARDLAGRRICTRGESPAEGAVLRQFHERRLPLTLRPARDDAAAEADFYSGRCDAWAADVSLLAAARARREPRGAPGLRTQRARLLPGLLSREPLAVVVRQEDVRLLDVIRWTTYLLIEAEERGIRAADVEPLQRAGRLDDALALAPGAVPAPGIGNSWAGDVLRAVGNYAEVYDRNLGPRTPVALERGLNRLWRDGGLLYAPLLH